MNWFFLQIFISAATMPTQRDKRVSPSWLTTGCCSALNFDQPYIHLMRENNWTSVYLVIDAATPMTPVIASAVARAVQKMNNTQHTDFTIPRGGRNEETIDSLLREFNRSSRGKHLLNAEPPIDHAPFFATVFQCNMISTHVYSTTKLHIIQRFQSYSTSVTQTCCEAFW